MWLMAPLRAETGKNAAKALGVSYRTVSGAVESGQLTARMNAELERHLLLGAARLPPSLVDCLYEEAHEPQQSLFSWAEFMAEEPVKPKGRGR